MDWDGESVFRVRAMSTWMKVAAIIIAAFACFVGGYRYAAALYGADISELREDYATRAQALEAKYRQKEEENAKAVVAAWEERDRARRDALRLDDDLARVRDEADALKRKLSRAPSDPCAPCRSSLDECSGLLERGAELLARGGQLAQDVAADKDAVVRITK